MRLVQGTCDDLPSDGGILLNPPDKGAARRQGPDDAIAGDISVTLVDLSIGDLVASPRSLVVQASADKPNSVLVCGEIGGSPLPDGALVVGLREMRGSAYSGVAYLTSDPSNLAQTTIWVFTAKHLSDDDPGD